MRAELVAGISGLVAEAAPAGADTGETVVATAGAFVVAAATSGIPGRASPALPGARLAGVDAETGERAEAERARDRPYLTVLVIAVGLLASLAWGLARFAPATRGDRPPLATATTTERIAA